MSVIEFLSFSLLVTVEFRRQVDNSTNMAWRGAVDKDLKTFLSVWCRDGFFGEVCNEKIVRPAALGERPEKIKMMKFVHERKLAVHAEHIKRRKRKPQPTGNRPDTAENMASKRHFGNRFQKTLESIAGIEREHGNA